MKYYNECLSCYMDTVWTYNIKSKTLEAIKNQVT